MIAKEDVRGRIKSKNFKDLEIIDPEEYEDTEQMASEYYELRKMKGMTPEEAKETIRKDYLTFGAMLVRDGIADGFVAAPIILQRIR